MYYGKIDKELKDYLDKYKEVFKEGLPLMQFDGTREELIEEIKKCISTGKEYDTSFWDDNPEYDT